MPESESESESGGCVLYSYGSIHANSMRRAMPWQGNLDWIDWVKRGDGPSVLVRLDPCRSAEEEEEEEEEKAG